MEKFKKIGRVIIPAAAVLLPMLVMAQSLQNPTVPVGGTAITLDEIQDLIRSIAQILIVSGVIIAVIAIIWGGILWITAGGSSTRLDSAKAWVKNGVIGALIVLAVGVILQTVAAVVTRTFFGS